MECDPINECAPAILANPRGGPDLSLPDAGRDGANRENQPARLLSACEIAVAFRRACIFGAGRGKHVQRDSALWSGDDVVLHAAGGDPEVARANINLFPVLYAGGAAGQKKAPLFLWMGMCRCAASRSEADHRYHGLFPGKDPGCHTFGQLACDTCVRVVNVEEIFVCLPS